jgi:hypothetical protein
VEPGPGGVPMSELEKRTGDFHPRDGGWLQTPKYDDEQLVAKTGDFHLRVELPQDPELPTEERKAYQWRRLLDKMTSCVAAATEDGRAYDLRLKVGEWRDLVDGAQEREVDFVLTLVRAADAQPGEWVTDLSMKVPDDLNLCRLPGVGLFNRGRFGWLRVE